MSSRKIASIVRADNGPVLRAMARLRISASRCGA
jgi:hypothetical protein